MGKDNDEKAWTKQLNGRQKAFVRAYVAQGCQNALQATRAAGYAESSSPRRSNLLMKHPEIKAQIDKLNKKAEGRQGHSLGK